MLASLALSKSSNAAVSISLPLAKSLPSARFAAVCPAVSDAFCNSSKLCDTTVGSLSASVIFVAKPTLALSASSALDTPRSALGNTPPGIYVDGSNAIVLIASIVPETIL